MAAVATASRPNCAPPLGLDPVTSHPTTNPMSSASSVSSDARTCGAHAPTRLAEAAARAALALSASGFKACGPEATCSGAFCFEGFGAEAFGAEAFGGEAFGG